MTITEILKKIRPGVSCSKLTRPYILNLLHVKTLKQMWVASAVRNLNTNFLQKITTICFILSSEIMDNINVIKVVSIYSEMIRYHFTIHWYHHSMSDIHFSKILDLISFRKDSACIVLACHYSTDICTSNQATDVTLWRHFWARVMLICMWRQSNGS